MVGKTITDELAYSLNGDNVHYGTPKNTKAPDRVPGGSSSGSAAAVAAGLCDFALGTDSGGSVRIPASYCGVYGVRTTVGVISMDGVVPFMPTFDTVGWFARDAGILSAVGDVLLPSGAGGARGLPNRLMIAADAISIVDRDALPVLERGIDMLAESFEQARPVTIAPQGLERWREIYRERFLHTKPGRSMPNGSKLMRSGLSPAHCGTVCLCKDRSVAPRRRRPARPSPRI